MSDRFPPQYYAFFRLFNEGDYYECHDVLEELWLEDKQNKFLQGLLQLAVGLYHFECGNIKGARWMFTNAKKYLEKYLPCHWDLELAPVLSYLDMCLAALPPVDRIPYEQVKAMNFPRIRLSSGSAPGGNGSTAQV